MKRIIYLEMASLIIFGLSLSWAFMCGGKMHLAQAKGAEAVSQGKVEVGNAVCPVGNEKIEEGEAIKLEHEGKIYNLCCKACAKDFKKDPKKYIEKLEIAEKEETTGHEGHTSHAH